MRKIVIIILGILLYFNSNAQSKSDKFVIATIQKKSQSDLHPIEYDYWIASISDWEEIENPFVPLYLEGFSKSDMDECTENDNLVLFNVTTNESYDFAEPYQQSISRLTLTISVEKTKVQSVKKKWKGYKESITVYLTPIEGEFCFCALSHYKGNDRIGYNGRVAIPLGDFKLYNGFEEGSGQFKSLSRTDFSKLPFLCLQNMQ